VVHRVAVAGLLGLIASVAPGCGGGAPSAEREPPAASTTTTTTTAAETTAPPTTAAPTTTTTEPVDVTTLRPPAPARDPAGLARQIAVAEAVLRTDGAGEAEVAEAALAQQVAYRQLGDHPAWEAEVLAALPAELRPVAESHAPATTCGR